MRAEGRKRGGAEARPKSGGERAYVPVAAGALGTPLGAWARCDPGCFGVTTFRGHMHAVLVVLTVPLIDGAMVVIWRRVGRHAAWRGYGRYTLATANVGVGFQ